MTMTIVIYQRQINHPYALADTTINIKNKITICHDIKLDITDAISLFKLSITELKLFRQTHEKDKLLLDQYPNRIEYLAHSLDQSVSQVCSYLSTCPSILNITFQKIKETTEFLLEVGVTGEHILCDLHVYKFSHKTVRTRVNRAIKAQINPIKPWVVRCPLSIIVNAENKLAKRKLLLDGADSLEVYISNIMNCSIESSEAFLKRGIKIDKISLPDLTKKLKFLRDKGYTIEDIYRLPSCLHASYNTLVQKYDLWIKMDLKMNLKIK
ncbi:transcription termination factor, mitochondrial [Aphidius gifuensis]|uniref:transcription termination factor, mitochondrial n=1 Tax=Aphidius gifuensis TaxID=684658 RepID=UPI001CDB6E8A|nr:transcription termination factor, mitochondrial [Aphidius gifuensis]